jgi:hypothetical protein
LTSSLSLRWQALVCPFSHGAVLRDTGAEHEGRVDDDVRWMG